jgi:chromate transporter
LLAVAVVNAFLVVFTRREIVSLLLLSGAMPFLLGRLRARAGAPAALATSTDPAQLLEIFVFFTKAALVVFGSGLAIIPFLQAEVVSQRGWLTEPQFLDAIAVAMLTPGPVVITVAFIGWLVAGPLGGVAAALGVFAPTWLVTVVGAPLYDRVRGSVAVREIVAGITAAATGALAGAVVIVALGALTTWTALLVALSALGVLIRFPKVPEPMVLLVAALVGLLASR